MPKRVRSCSTRGNTSFKASAASATPSGKATKWGPDLAGRDRSAGSRLARPLRHGLRTRCSPRRSESRSPFREVQYARMPNLRLSSDEVAAVLSYVEARSRAPREPTRKDSITADSPELPSRLGSGFVPRFLQVANVAVHARLAAASPSFLLFSDRQFFGICGESMLVSKNFRRYSGRVAGVF